MKFLLQKDLIITIDLENLNEIISNTAYIIDECEDRAIEMVKEYLRGRYDIDFELRSYQTYTTYADYSDNVRVRLIQNTIHDDFGSNFNIQLIDHNLNSIDEYILVKKVNTCPSQKLNKPIQSFYEDTELYNIVDNPDYSPSCGIIESFITGKIFNYYNSLYSTSGITQIDFTVTDPSTIIGNLTYFDQFRLENLNRDFLTDDRNPSLKTLVLDLMKYELFQRVAPKQISQIVVDRHDLAIDRLVKASKGIITMNLKPLAGTTEFQNNSPFRFGWSEQNRRFKY